MYKLELPPEIKVHSKFHISILKPFKEDTLWLDRKQVIRPPSDLVGDHLQNKVEGILKCRKHKRKRKEYLVKWPGNHKKEATWVAAKDMMHAKEIVERFEKTRARGSNKSVPALRAPLILDPLFFTSKHHEHQLYTCNTHLGLALNLLP